MALKIVHISTHDNGGAGLAAYRLHRGLLCHGIESRMIVAHKTKDDNTVILATQDERLLYQPPKNTILRKYQKIMRRRGKYLTRFERTQKEIEGLHNLHPDVFYTSPISTYNLSVHPLVQEADVIHLHWVQNFVNFDFFFQNVKKTIVWTFHDLNPMMGGFHYEIPQKKYHNDFKCIEEEFYAIKKNAISHASNLSIVAISKQMKDRISNHEFYKDKTIYNIPNSVDGNSFIQHDKKQVRQLLGIPLDKTVFLFSSLVLYDKRKGLDVLIEALEQEKDNALLICLGEGTACSHNGVIIRNFSLLYDSEWISMLYSAADYFVSPSCEESFLQTALESLSCGTPVIMTPVGIGEELITTQNGVLCSDFTPEAIVEGITIALSRNYDREAMRNDVLKRFGIDVVVKKHLDMYNSILK